jgi:hypothetical protein
MNMQRHRSLSGGTSNQTRFQFPDAQFTNNSNSQMGMLQQQQMYSGRMLPRQMSMPGMSVISMVFILKNLAANFSFIL